MIGKCVIEKRYTISQRRWQILISAFLTFSPKKEVAGYGMYFHEKPLEKRQIIEELYRMIKEGVLLPKEEILEMNGEYKELLETCERAKIGCFLENKEHTSNFLFYLGEESVICEPSSVRKNSFCFSMIKLEEIPVYLMKTGFFPEYQIENAREDSRELTIPLLKSRTEELFHKNQAETILTLLDLKNGENIARLALWKEGGEEYLIWEGLRTSGRRLFLKENLKKVWKELTKYVVCGGGSTNAWSGL